MIENYERELEKIRKFVGAIDDLRPVFQIFLRKYRNLIARNFSDEGAFFGERWAQLSKRYKARKEKIFPGRKILERTRRMMTAAKGFGFEKYEVITPDRLEFGIRAGDTGIPYARTMQYGNITKKIPARPYMFLSSGKMPIQGLRVLRAELENYVKQVVNIARERGVL